MLYIYGHVDKYLILFSGRQIKYNRPKRGGIVDCHVDANRHPFHGAGYDRRPSRSAITYRVQSIM